jgi:hypothetical protein
MHDGAGAVGHHAADAHTFQHVKERLSERHPGSTRPFCLLAEPTLRMEIQFAGLENFPSAAP